MQWGRCKVSVGNTIYGQADNPFTLRLVKYIELLIKYLKKLTNKIIKVAIFFHRWIIPIFF